MKKLLIHTWTAYSFEGKYYLPYMHWVYLNEIQQYFSKIYIIIPVGNIKDTKDLILMDFLNVEILSVPFYSNYKGALKTFFYYVKRYYFLPEIDVAYARYPAPFGWLQKFFLRKTERIIHFVGDPIDAANNNPNFTAIKKRILTTLFFPEKKLFEWACVGAKVYTNGFHIAERLKVKKILAEPLISSTLREQDFYFDDNKVINTSPKLIYIGYLRTAKGIETIVNAFSRLLKDYPKSVFTIIGEGEFESELKDLVLKLQIEENVMFHGFIDDRKKINRFLRSHDLFCFGSLSEGSPRVILEAMANGINVLSTPVGSLPSVFDDKENIVYANFKDDNDFYIKMKYMFENIDEMFKIRLNAFNKVKTFTIKKFIKTIFYNESNNEK